MATDAEVAALEAAITGLAPLTGAGIKSLRDNSKLLRVVRNRQSGEAVALLSLRTEPGGWGVIDQVLVAASETALRRPLIEWSIAWLRNNGGRRVRMRSGVDDTALLTLLKDIGFTAGEVGFYLTRSVDRDEVAAKLAERKNHGTLIKFGDWRSGSRPRGARAGAKRGSIGSACATRPASLRRA